MKTTHLNKILMFRRVLRVCQNPEHAAATGSIVSFRNDCEQFAALMDPIQKLTGTSITLMTNGVSADKAALRGAMAEQAAKVSAGLVNMAECDQDEALARDGRLTRSDVSAGRELEVAAKVDALLKLALTHVARLETFGVSQDRINDLDTLCEQFSQKIGRPRELILERKSANRTLPELLAEADVFLKRMDRTMLLLEESYPAFADSFRNNRRIVNTAATRSLSDAELKNAEERKAMMEESRLQKAANVTQRREEAARKQAERKNRLERLKRELDAPIDILPARPAAHDRTAAAGSDAPAILNG